MIGFHQLHRSFVVFLLSGFFPTHIVLPRLRLLIASFSLLSRYVLGRHLVIICLLHFSSLCSTCQRNFLFAFDDRKARDRVITALVRLKPPKLTGYSTRSPVQFLRKVRGEKSQNCTRIACKSAFLQIHFVNIYTFITVSAALIRSHKLNIIDAQYHSTYDMDLRAFL